MKPTRICFIRHGETDWNLAHRLQGHTDIPLNARGMQQAQAVAERLHQERFAAIYSSDLQRAQYTAQAVADRLGLPLQLAPGLRERHCGPFQGLTREQCRENFPQQFEHYAARDPYFDFGTGESLLALQARVVTTVEAMAARHSGEALLLVTHGGVLDIVYRLATGLALTQKRNYAIPNAALNWIMVDGQAWHLEAWADKGHLAQTRELVVE